MPHSLKCKIKHLCHNGTITERECGRILKALEQETILNKIKDEITDTGAYEQETMGQTAFLNGINYCLGVIDKYKEDKENG